MGGHHPPQGNLRHPVSGQRPVPGPGRALGAVLVGGGPARPRHRTLLSLSSTVAPARDRLPSLPPPGSGLHLRASSGGGHRTLLGDPPSVLPPGLRHAAPAGVGRRRPRRAVRRSPHRPPARWARTLPWPSAAGCASHSRILLLTSPCRPSRSHELTVPGAQSRSQSSATRTLTW